MDNFSISNYQPAGMPRKLTQDEVAHPINVLHDLDFKGILALYPYGNTLRGTKSLKNEDGTLINTRMEEKLQDKLNINLLLVKSSSASRGTKADIKITTEEICYNIHVVDENYLMNKTGKRGFDLEVIDALTTQPIFKQETHAEVLNVVPGLFQQYKKDNVVSYNTAVMRELIEYQERPYEKEKHPEVYKRRHKQLRYLLERYDENFETDANETAQRVAKMADVTDESAELFQRKVEDIIASFQEDLK